MSILVNKSSKILIQGITGIQASFHVKRSLESGTQIVAGTSPGHGGEKHLGIPVFDNVYEAQRKYSFDASVMFVPAMAVKNAAREAIEAEIKLIVSIASGVPVHDMLEIRDMLQGSKTLMIGPNTPGVITPKEARLGIFPDNILQKGSIGIISRSSTLTYEAILQTNQAGLGQSTVVGLGDDMIIGTDFRKLIRLFIDDENTKAIVMVGKADNTYEQIAAEYYASLERKKPIIAFVAGESLPYGHNMGYAADIITRGRITVADKKRIMRDCGILVADDMNDIHHILADLQL